MKLLTAKQMAAADRAAIEEGIRGLDLMERAGAKVFAAARSLLGGPGQGTVAVVCGKGNNGGDGLVAARLLHQEGVGVLVFLVGSKADLKGDALTNLERGLEKGVVVCEVLAEGDLSLMKEGLGRADLVVDAILGTGVQGAPHGLCGWAIEAINASGKPVVAVDVPSGLDSDTGQMPGVCVRADRTVTFGSPKIGHVFYPGRAACGFVEVVDIGIPSRVMEGLDCHVHLTTPRDAAGLLPRRAPTVHKGACGRVAVVAGSVGMTGAAALASEAALRSGAGLVVLGLPESLNDLMEVKLTEVMTRPLPELRKRRCLALRGLGEIRALAAQADVLAIGPGIGRHPETRQLVRRVVAETRIPLVIDADGLNALADAADVLRESPGDVVVTPHVGEFSRLSGVPISEVLKRPREAALEFAQEVGVTVVLKNAPSMVAAPDGELFVNPTGNPGLATAGSGDVLTGIVAGLMAQGLPGKGAATLGVYLHGWAGDLAKAAGSEMGFIAGDVLAALPRAIRAVLEQAALDGMTFEEGPS